MDFVSATNICKKGLKMKIKGWKNKYITIGDDSTVLILVEKVNDENGVARDYKKIYIPSIDEITSQKWVYKNDIELKEIKELSKSLYEKLDNYCKDNTCGDNECVFYEICDIYGSFDILEKISEVEE